MKFTLGYSRDVIGNKITMKVLREKAQLISEVSTELDRFVLGRDRLADPAVHFERHFRQAGQAGPGTEHTLVVTATDQDGNSEVATKIWVDEK